MKKNFYLYETIKASVKEALLEVLALMYGASTLEAGSDDDGGSGNNEGEDDDDSNNNNGSEDKDKKDPIRPKPILGPVGFGLR